MPESPEVQSLVEYLGERMIGRTITAVDVMEFRTVQTRTRPPAELVGGEVTALQRLGKHVDLTIGSKHLGVALGRHGWARWHGAGEQPGSEPDQPPVLARIDLDDGAALELTDAGGWVSLGLSVIDRPEDVAAVAKLGRDPADPTFTPADLDAVLLGRRKQLKAVLQEQESLAGIGNAYSTTAQYCPTCQTEGALL